MAKATILKLNAHGARWHVMIVGKGILFSGPTKRSCKDFCRRRNLNCEAA